MARIACITPMYFSDASYIGGGERYPLNLSRGVVESTGGAYEVEMISFGAEPFRRPLYPGVTLRVLKAAVKPINTLDVVSWELPRAIADCDLVHIHQAYTRCSEHALLAARQQKKPIVITDHGGMTSGLGPSLGSLELADEVVCYSEFGAAQYTTTRPIRLVKGGVDGHHFRPSETPVERDRVLYVGRILPHKGIDRLIKALPEDMPLSICGRPYHADYFEYLKTLCRGKEVMFFTDLDDAAIQSLYRRSWANVLPSVYRDHYGVTYLWPELMGFTLLEAMACGTPAICSRVAAMPEYVDHGETGFIFDEIDDLREILTTLANDRDLVERMGRKARKVIEEHYDFRVAGAKLAGVYERLLGRRAEVAA